MLKFRFQPFAVGACKAGRNFPRDERPEAVQEHLRHATADGDMFTAIDEAEFAWACG
jgi:hypothetical protein